MTVYSDVAARSALAMRRTRRVLASVAMVAGMLMLGVIGWAEDWDTFRHDATRTARNSTDTLRPPLEVIWCAKIPGNSGNLTSSAAVSDCHIFLGLSRNFTSTTNGGVRIFDANNGTVLGDFTPGMLGTPFLSPGLGTKVHVSPTAPAGNDRFYYGVANMVYGIKRDLSAAWSFQVNSPASFPFAGTGFGIYSSPVVDCGLDELWIGADGLYKLHASNGILYPGGFNDMGPYQVSHSSPVLLVDQVIVGSASQNFTPGDFIWSFDRCSLAVKWQVSVGGNHRVYATPSFDPIRGRIVAGSSSDATNASGMLYCLDTAGTVQWMANAGDMYAGAPLETSSTDPSSGTAYVESGWVLGSVGRVGMRAYVIGQSGPVGLPTWVVERPELGWSIESSPALVGDAVNGVLYAASDVGMMVTFNASDGLPAAPNDVFTATGQINAQPTPANNFVYVNTDGNIFTPGAGILYGLSSPGFISSAPPCTLTASGSACDRPPPPLAAALSTNTNAVCAGDTFEVRLTVTNEGAAQIDQVNIAGFEVSPPGTASFQSGPSPALPVTVGPGASGTFTWIFLAGAAAGPIFISTTVTGVDPCTQEPFQIGPLIAGPIATCPIEIPIAPGPGDWPQFHHDENNTGTSPSALCANPILDWSRTLGPRIGSFFSYASPSVLSGSVFVGTLDGSLEAIQSSNGALVWSFPVGAPIEHAPAAVQFGTRGIVVVGTPIGLAGIDTGTGLLLWTVTMSGGLLRASPLLSNGYVYAVSTGGEAVKVFAFDGRVIWRNSALGSGTDTGPVLGNGTLYVLRTVGADVQVLQLSPTTGAFVLVPVPPTIPNVSPALTDPTFAGNMLLFGTAAGAFVVMDAATDVFCTSLITSPPAALSTPAVDGNQVYVDVANVPLIGKGCGPNGTVGVWTAVLGGAPSAVCASFTQLVSTPGDVFGAPAVSQGDGIFYPEDECGGSPVAFNATTPLGVSQFAYPVLPGIAARGSPAIAASRVYFTATTGPKSPGGDHVLYAFKCLCGVAPPSLTATPTPKGCDISLCWTAPQGGFCAQVTGFKVFRSTCAFPCPAVQVSGTLLLGGMCFTDTTTGAGQTYFYRVCTVDINGTILGCSPEVQVTSGTGTNPPILSNPIFLPNGQINCHFLPPPDCPCPCTTYTVFRSTIPGTIGVPIAVVASPTGFIDTSTTLGDVFCYTIMCTDQFCPGTTSMQACTTCEVPLEARQFCVEGVGRKVELDFGLVGSCGTAFSGSGFAVYRAPVSAGGVVGAFTLLSQQTPWPMLCPKVIQTPSGPQTIFVPCYTDTPGAGDWMYRVCALTSLGTVCSADVPVTVAPMFAGTFLTGATQTGPNEISLTWGSSTLLCEPPCTAYYVFHSTGGMWQQIPGVVVDGTVGIFPDPSPIPGFPDGHDCYALRCIRPPLTGLGPTMIVPGPFDCPATGTGACSATAYVLTTATPVCQSEVGVGAFLEWEAVGAVSDPGCSIFVGAVGYQVSRSLSPTMAGAVPVPWTGTSCPRNSTMFPSQFVPCLTDIGLVPGTTYFYQVCTVPGAGGVSVCGPVVAVTTPSLYAGTFLTGATQTGPNEISLTWGSSTLLCEPPCTAYYVFHSTGGMWQQIPGVVVDGTVGIFPDPSPIPGFGDGHDCYALRCIDPPLTGLGPTRFVPGPFTCAAGGGGGGCSSTLYVLTTATPVCQSEVGVGAFLEWEAVGAVSDPGCSIFVGAVGYQVSRSLSPSMAGAVPVPWAATSCPRNWTGFPSQIVACLTDMGLQPGTTYFYQVCTVPGAGGVSVCGPVVAVTTPLLLTGKFLTGATQTGPNEISLTWGSSTLLCEPPCTAYYVFHSTGGMWQQIPGVVVDGTVGIFPDPSPIPGFPDGHDCYALRCIRPPLTGFGPTVGVAGPYSCLISGVCSSTVFLGFEANPVCLSGAGLGAFLEWGAGVAVLNPGCPIPALNVAGYQVFRSLSPTMAGAVAVPWGGMTCPDPGNPGQFVACLYDLGLVPGTTYYYQIFTIPGPGGGPVASRIVSVAVRPTPTFSGTYLKEATQTGPNQITLTWGSSTLLCEPPCTAYYVFHSTGGLWQQIPGVVVDGTVGIFPDPSPIPGFGDGHDCYLLRCINPPLTVQGDIVGVPGPFICGVSGTGACSATVFVPITATPICVSGVGLGAHLLWNAYSAVLNPGCPIPPVNVVGYQVFRSLSPTMAGAVAVPWAGTRCPDPYAPAFLIPCLDDIGLMPATTYYYQVFTIPGPGGGPVSSQIVQVDTRLTPLFTGKVLAGVTTPAPGVLLLEWKVVGPICGVPCTEYTIFRDTGSGQYPQATVDENTIVFVDTVPAGTGQLCYSISCINGGGTLIPRALVCSACLATSTAICSSSGGAGQTGPVTPSGPINGLFGTIFTASAAIGGGVAACGNLEVLGTADGTVYVLFADGRVKCQTTLNGPIEFSPVYDQCTGRAWVGTAKGFVYPIDINNCGAAGPVCGGGPLPFYDLTGFGSRISGPIALDCNGNPEVSVDSIVGGVPTRCLIKLDAQACAPGGILQQQCFPVAPGAPAVPPYPLCGASSCPTCRASCSLFEEACLECPLQSWAALPDGDVIRVQKCGNVYKLCCDTPDGRQWCCSFDGFVFQPAVSQTRHKTYVAVMPPEGPAVFVADLDTGTCSFFCSLSANPTGTPYIIGDRLYTPVDTQPMGSIESCCLDPANCTPVAPISAGCPSGSSPGNLQVMQVIEPGFVTTELMYTCGNELHIIYTQPGPPQLTSVQPQPSGNRLDWLAPTSSSSGLPVNCYTVYRSIPGGPEAVIASCVPGLAFIDVGATAGVVVCYRVQAVDSAGNTSSKSNELCAPSGPLPVVALVLSAPLSVTTGTAFTLKITAVDVNGETVTTYTGTVALTSTDPLASLAAPVTFTPVNAGVANVTTTLLRTGITTVTGYDTLTTTITGSTKIAVVCPTTTDVLVFNLPALVQPGIAFSLTLTAMNASGPNAGLQDANFKGTVGFASSDPAAVLPGPYTFTTSAGKTPGDDGSHVFVIVLNTTGVQILVANDTKAQCKFSGVTTTTVIVPSVGIPANLIAQCQSNGTIDLAWLAPLSTLALSGYQIFRSTPGVAFTQIGFARGATVTTYQDVIAAEFNVPYNYQIVAMDIQGHLSGTSNISSCTLAPPADWPIASYWMQHSGFSPTANPTAPWELKWRVAGTFNSSFQGTGGSVVAGGRVYQMFDNSVLGTDLLSGEVLAFKKFPIGLGEGHGTNLSSPAIIGNLVVLSFATSNIFGFQAVFSGSDLYAFDKDTLELRWSSHDENELSTPFGGFSNLVASGQLVYGGNPNGLAAVSLVSGKLVWADPAALSYTFPGPFPGPIPVKFMPKFGIGGPIVDSDSLLFASFPNGTLRAVDSRTGGAVWSKNIGTDPQGSPFQPVLRRGVLIAGSGKSLKAFDARTGAILGQIDPVRTETDFGVLGFSPVIDSQDHIYFFTGSSTGSATADRLHAYDAAPIFTGGTATLLWERSDVTANVLSAAGGVLTAFQSDSQVSEGLGGMLLLSTTDGQVLERMEGAPTIYGTTTAPTWGSPLVGDKLLLSTVDLSMAAPGPGVNAPLNPVAVSGQGTIDLTWDSPAPQSFGISFFHVFRSTNPFGFVASNRIAVVSTPSFTDGIDTGLQPSVTEYYVIRAEDAVGNLSPPSTIVSAVAQPTGSLVHPVKPLERRAQPGTHVGTLGERGMGLHARNSSTTWEDALFSQTSKAP